MPEPDERDPTGPGESLTEENDLNPIPVTATPRTAWPGRTRPARFSRATGATLVAVLGLVLLVLGPTAVALGWHEGLRTDDDADGVAVGTPFRDGPVTFLVNEVRCGPDENGESLNGRWCAVTATARNTGEEEIVIPGPVQKLHGPVGARHLPVNDSTPFGTLEPGEEVTAVLEFDLPPHAQVTHVSLYAEPYSPGGVVRIGDDLLPLTND